MIAENKKSQTITCDKCGVEQTAQQPGAGDVFFRDGWLANFRAKIYVHVCRDCQTKKQRKVHDFVATIG